MSRHRDEHLDLCAARVLGVLDESGRLELEAHLSAGCPTCEAELRALSAGAAVLALSVPQHRAPDGARDRLLEAVRSEGVADVAPGSRPYVLPAPPARPRKMQPAPAAWAWTWAAAAVVLAVTGVFAWRRADELSAALRRAEARSSELQRTLEAEKRWSALLETPETRVVRLAPTPEGEAALVAQVLYDPSSRRAIVVASRFALPRDRDYELWAITASGPTSLGLVRADASGRVVARFENVAGAEAIAAFAVSLEPSGGSPDHHRPSGPVVMVGKLAG